MVCYFNPSFSSFSFSSQYTGNAYADFLLGLPDTTGYTYTHTPEYARLWYLNSFVQDDWKVRQNLTLSSVCATSTTVRRSTRTTSSPPSILPPERSNHHPLLDPGSVCQFANSILRRDDDCYGALYRAGLLQVFFHARPADTR